MMSIDHIQLEDLVAVGARFSVRLEGFPASAIEQDLPLVSEGREIGRIKAVSIGGYIGRSDSDVTFEVTSVEPGGVICKQLLCKKLGTCVCAKPK